MFTRSLALRSLCSVTALLAASVVQGQNINVTAANASNDAIYTVSFQPPGISPTENSDGGKLHSLRSLVFTENVVNDQLDLLAADTAGGLIVRYCGDFTAGPNPGPQSNTAGVVVFPVNNPVGPSDPDGLSVDSAGNVFVANQGSGTSTNPQLWVLQGLGTDCTAKKQPTPTVAEIDSVSYGAKETLEETLIAATTIPLPQPNCGGPGQLPCFINPGDLLVLTTNPVAPGSRVLLYPGSGGLGPCTSPGACPPGNELTPFTLISLGTGVSPGGMAFWPVDNSLLVTTGTGDILQFNLTTLVQESNFFSGLGNGQFKIKTGIQAGSPFAFVADNNGGRILEFNGNGPNQTPITVTNGVQHPQGLAVTNIGFLPFAQCSPGPCAPLDPANKKLITHQVPLNANGQPPFGGNIVEDICIRVDPRSDGNGNCPNVELYPKGLPVAQMCGAAFDNVVTPIYIPNYLCGASGPNKNSFALVRTLTQAYNNPNQFPLNGIAIEHDALFPGAPDCIQGSPPPVPLPVLAWAPLAGEGAALAGNDVSLPSNSLREITSGCGGGHSNGPYLSLWGIGFDVVANLTDFANNKYATILSTLNNAGYFQQPPLQPRSLPDGNGNNTQLQQCVNTSQLAFVKGNSYAALELLIVDQYIVNNASNTSIFPPSGTYSPDPSDLVQALVENLYFTIDERINNPPSPFPISTTPPVSPLPQAAPIPPTITGTPPKSWSAGTFFSFTPTAAEFFGGPAPAPGKPGAFTFSVMNAPPWAAPIDPTTGTLSGTALKGTFKNIMISVTDGCASNTLTFDLKVTGP